MAGGPAYVAVNMVKAEEVAEVTRGRDWGAVSVMAVTAGVVLAEDFLTGIAAGLLLHLTLDVARAPPTPDSATRPRASLPLLGSWHGSPGIGGETDRAA